MADQPTTEPRQHRLLAWLEERYPMRAFWQKAFTQYLVPKNLNVWYLFGVLAVFILVIQLCSGVWLTMFYTPTAKQAFASIEGIMRDVPYGWLLRYLHTTGASALFIVLYLHLFRGLLYGSYQRPRELLWITGVLVYCILLAEAFFGYLLPWGQVSYWGAQVVTSLASAIPGIGDGVMQWLRGDYQVSEVTLHRFFALHIVAIPLLLYVLVKTHLIALRQVGSNSPPGEGDAGEGIQPIPFHPYYTIKDLLGCVVFLIAFFAILCYAPQLGGLFIDPANSIPANPLVTPEQIAPLWYTAPYYAMLRAIPSKPLGIIVVVVAIAVLFALPWLDKSPVKAIKRRAFSAKLGLSVMVLSFIGLGVLGRIEVTPFTLWLARGFTFGYLSVFMALPCYSRFERKGAA